MYTGVQKLHCAAYGSELGQSTVPAGADAPHPEPSAEDPTLNNKNKILV